MELPAGVRVAERPIRTESLATFLAAGSSLLALADGGAALAAAALAEAADLAESLATFLAAGSSLLALGDIGAAATPEVVAVLAVSRATFLAAGSSLLVLAAWEGTLAKDCESTISFGILCNTRDDGLPAFLAAGSAAELMEDAPGAVAAVAALPADVFRAAGGGADEPPAMIAWILLCFSCGVSEGSCITACIALRDSEICSWSGGAGAADCGGCGADCCGGGDDAGGVPAGAGEPPAMIT
jgi:hypothetical protein